MKRAWFPFVTFILFLACVSLAEAHAFLNDAEPAVGSTVKTSPSVVKIWFTTHIRAGLSSIQVLDAAKREVDLRDDRVDPSDPSLLIVSVPKLVAGAYKVTWTAVCIDSHTTHGSFNFTVAEP